MDNMEWVPPKPRLQGGGVAIRPFRPSDAAAVASACRDPDILRFTFMKDGLTEGEAGEWINNANERWPMGHPRFAVVDAHDDRLLGQVGLNFNPRHVSAEAYYWVVASERGRGIASRALSLLIDWGFSKGIERVFLVIHPENKSSNRWRQGWGSREKGYCGPMNRSRVTVQTSSRGRFFRVTRALGGRPSQCLPQSGMCGHRAHSTCG